MSAVVRVKRRIDEEPLATFVLNGKKRRLDNEFVDEAHAAGKDEISTVLNFAGTIPEQDNNVTTQFARQQRHKDAAKTLVQHKVATANTSTHTERARQEMRKSLHEQRFCVVNCLRALPLSDLDDDDDDPNENNASAAAAKRNESQQITIVDIERETKPTQEPLQPTDSDTGYVYDLYLPENEQQAADVDLMDNYLSVYVYDNLTCEEYNNDDNEDDNDSEDSNQEDYYANDYPDEEGSMCEIISGVDKFMLSDDDDDSGEDDKDSEDSNQEDDENINFYQDPYVQITSNGKSDSSSDDDEYESANEHD